jgi:hypothetical protein
LQLDELESRRLLSLSIHLSYDFDANHFFDSQAKRDVMQRAADTIGGMLDDSLAAITPSGADHWLATFANPSTGQPAYVSDLTVPADTLIVFVGGCNLGPGMLGASTGGGGQVAGSASWFDHVRSRDQAGVLGSPETDFGPWGGSLAFNTAGVEWYLGLTTAGMQDSQYDLYSTALHELGHILGYGFAPSWQRNVISDSSGSSVSFHGPASMAAHSGAPVLLADPGHWAMGVTSDGTTVAMDPGDWPCQRHEFTRLDLAGLTDIGWLVAQSYLQFGDATYTVREDCGNAKISVIRFGDTSSTASVHYATADGTARSDGDYGAVSGTLVFGPGQTIQTFDVPIRTDGLIEPTEGLHLVLSDPIGIRTYGSPGLAALRILDVPPPPPTMSISDATVVEGNRGTSIAYFTVSLSSPYGYPVSVVCETCPLTAPGTAAATPGVDYLSLPATVLLFRPGEVVKTIGVTVRGDRTVEPDESFGVRLRNATHAIIVRGQGVGRILNDDNRLTISNVRVNEPSRGTATATFIVRLSARAPFPVSVVCSTADVTATAGSDYSYLPPTVLRFRPGETRKTVTVRVYSDPTLGPNESFRMILSNPTNAVIATSTGTATIIQPRIRRPARTVRALTTLPLAAAQFANRQEGALVIGPVPEAIDILDLGLRARGAGGRRSASRWDQVAAIGRVS